MNKEELLAKSREENKNKDPYTMEVAKKSQRYAFIAGFIMVVLHFTARGIFIGELDYGLWSIMGVMIGVQYTYHGHKTGNPTTKGIGILWLGITVIHLVLAVIQLKDKVS